MVPDPPDQAGRGELRTGFSTGTAAAATAKAALLKLLEGETPQVVWVSLPGGKRLLITVAMAGRWQEGWTFATVIKNAGDDPDATHRAAIQARVRLLDDDGPEEIRIDAGLGVGRVTRPGLPLAVGEPAINPVPRRMIKTALKEAWGEREKPLRVEVVITAPEGERIAKHTLNPRLGILGGISILGTTGLVKPYSHDAYKATIHSALAVARAQGLNEAVLTTGGKSEKLAMELRPDLPEQAFVLFADYFGYALRQAAKRGFHTVGMICFFGKAVKQAQGLENTHAKSAPQDLPRLAEWLAPAIGDKKLLRAVAAANTAREALDMLREHGATHAVTLVGERVLASARGFLGPGPKLWVRIMDFSGETLYTGDEPGGKR